MCSSQRTCELLSEYLSSMVPSAERGSKGRKMMERRLRLYLWWKGKLSSNQKEGRGIFQLPASGPGDAPQHQTEANSGISDALKKKDAVTKDRLANRRRLRGGGPAAAASGRSQTPSLTTAQESSMSSKEREKLGIMVGEGEMRSEADAIADLYVPSASFIT